MEASEPALEPTMLDKLRNTWEFANIMQYIYIFGRVVKIDEDLTIEVLSPYITTHPLGSVEEAVISNKTFYADRIPTQDLEIECLKPEASTVLSDIGLALLKYVSSHRGLT